MNTADSPLLKPANPFERRVVQSIAAAKTGVGVGLYTKPLPGGQSLTLPSQPRAKTPPSVPLFNFPYRLGPGVFSITPGLYDGLPLRIDTNGGTSITADPPPEWELTDGALWLGIKYELDFDDDFLVHYELTGGAYIFAIESGDPDPVENPVTGQFFQLLATIVDDAIAENYGGTHLLGLLRDDGTIGSKSSALAIGRA